MLDAGEKAFRAEGAPKGLLPALKDKVPVAVEAEPVLPDQLGTGIALPGDAVELPPGLGIELLHGKASLLLFYPVYHEAGGLNMP